MNYLNEHIQRQKKKLQVSKGALQKGMIVSCTYTNKKGESKKNMLLILNPGYDKKIHALSLNRFSSKKLNDLASDVGIIDIPKYSMRGLDIPKLMMEQSSNRFYGSFLRNVKKEYNDAYRTLFISKLGSVSLVDYRFDKKVPKI